MPLAHHAGEFKKSFYFPALSRLLLAVGVRSHVSVCRSDWSMSSLKVSWTFYEWLPDRLQSHCWIIRYDWTVWFDCMIRTACRVVFRNAPFAYLWYWNVGYAVYWTLSLAVECFNVPSIPICVMMVRTSTLNHIKGMRGLIISLQ